MHTDGKKRNNWGQSKINYNFILEADFQPLKNNWGQSKINYNLVLEPSCQAKSEILELIGTL